MGLISGLDEIISPIRKPSQKTDNHQVIIPEIVLPDVLPDVQLSPEEIKIINDMEPMLLEFQRTWLVKTFLRRPERTVFLVCGNQVGKTTMIIFSYILRLYGFHPVEWKNMRPHVKVRTIRFASGSLPMDKNEDGETTNTIYPILKRWLPKHLIVDDITSRRQNVVVRDPQGGKNVIFEFVSYKQEVKTTQIGQQRFSYYEDEDGPKTFHEEQIPRLLKTQEQGYGGDIVMSLTPAEHLGWQFEDIFEKASVYIRTAKVIAAYKRYLKKELKQFEYTGNHSSIAVIQAASDDNKTLPRNPLHCDSIRCTEKENQGIAPTFTKTDKENQWGFKPYRCNDNDCGMLVYAPLDAACNDLGDLDIILIRRYGIFKQVSGAIFKQYDAHVHLIDLNKYFPIGINHEWKHARAIDYHTRIKWAVVWVVISPHDEIFIYNELNPDPRSLITLEISKIIIDISGDYEYYLNLIDPLAGEKQPKTGTSTLDDLNNYFYEFKQRNRGTGGFWQPWDTKSERGLNAIQERLQNAKLVGQPFCNKIVKEGREIYLPTLWIGNQCYNMAYSLKNWREELWANREMLVSHDEKGKPEGKNSHFCRCIDGLLKHKGFSSLQYHERILPSRKSPYNNFFGSRLDKKAKRGGERSQVPGR